MKFKFGENLLMVLLLFLLELIKRCSSLSINLVDPLIIKINPEKPENISFILVLDEDIGNRSNKKIKLEYNKTINEEFESMEEDEQDKNIKNKIEFKINLKLFEGKYGKYRLYYLDGNIIDYNETIFIYTNDLILKNPKKKYFLTGSGLEKEIKFDFSLPIILDEINKIVYYKESEPNNKTELRKENYKIKENKLAIDFEKTNESSSFVFDIYPEYDAGISNPEIQRFYLYFHDYLLKNDAIYINKDIYSNDISFNLTFRNNNTIGLRIIDYSYSSSYLNNKDYEITINLRTQNGPGKIKMSYNNQERELYYVLYYSNFQRCYDKENNTQLEITMEWIEEMEYDHILYFNDTTSKLLTSTYIGKSSSIVSYKYKYKTLSLNSGVFSLKSSIPSLGYSNDYNPVDNKHLYFFINPNSETFDKENSTIYSHNNSKQYVNITSPADPEGIKVLEQIILKSFDNKPEIVIPQTKDYCININGTLYCDLKDIIFNYTKEQNGDYRIIYKSKCNRNLTINGKIVTIMRGIGLSDIYPKWINKKNVSGSELILTYDDDLTDRKQFSICFISDKVNNNCVYPKNFTIEKEKVRVILNNMDEGKYYVRTIITEDKLNFTEREKSFKISDPNLDFKFNHHYFVKNNNTNNKLIITVEGDLIQFGCRIFERVDNKELDHNSGNCTHFEYKIDKIGTIRFNYFDEDNITIPINDFIVVVSTYSQFFLFNEKFCFYYKFDISIDILNSYKDKLNIVVFLKTKNNNSPFIQLNKSENNENKYTYKEINTSFINNQQFELYISEGFKDDKIYLYKSYKEIIFTAIETPKYIIEPNKTIVFYDVNCNLNSSIFLIKKVDASSIQNYLTYWKYDIINRQLYYNISGDFYQSNRFKDYYYQIDYINITNINDDELYQTFVSKRLNETIFEIKKEEGSNDHVIISNKEKDFYFPLIEWLNTYKKSRKQQIEITSRKDLIINDSESTIIFNYELSINDVLIFNYLKRRNETWEENLGNSTYYYFDKDNIINGSSFDISPKLFAFNIPTKEDYIITLLYDDEKEKNYSTKNLTNCSNLTKYNNNFKQDCLIDFSKIRNETAQSIKIEITDGISTFEENIDFAYYYLDKNSKQCQTKNSNMNNLTLLVKIPNPNLKNKINLASTDTDIIDEERKNDVISFILNGSNINLQKTYLNLFTDDGELDHLFSLQDLGIDILPKYKIRFNNYENKMYLLPEDNQIVKVIISTENNEIINVNDIKGFIIKENNKTLEKRKITGEPFALNLIFNLSSIDKSIKNYSLYYIDRCGKNIETDLKVILVTFNFRRKYFVLNNNKNLNYQTLIIEGPVNNKISISVFKNGEYYGLADTNNTSNHYLNFAQSSQGDYTFKVINDGIEADINETIYVRQNLDEILGLKDNISSCMFSNENKSAIKDFSFTITPSNINTSFKDFETYITDDQKNFINLTSTIYEKEKTFSIIYSKEMKDKISLNNKLYLYLTENDDIEQPIYIFSYSYTNIELHPDFDKFIYTDADYILFKMKCKINNLKFELFNNFGSYPIICEDRGTNDIYNEVSNEFKCYLSSDEVIKNKLIDFGETVFQYGDFNIKYDQVQITNKPFYLSQDIYKADFTIYRPSQIDRNKNITIDVKTQKKHFYFPQIEKVTYHYENKTENKDIEVYFNNIIDNYISFKLFIRNGTNYTIKYICRKPCIYCKKNENNDCQPLNDEYFFSNTPEVNFYFDKHYIALYNSTYTNGSNDRISILTITLEGENLDKIEQFIYIHYKDPNNIDNAYSINKPQTTFEINLLIGKYIFRYKYNNTYYDIEDEIVLVTNYDYEMFDFSDFSNKCIFYDLDSHLHKLLVSLNANPNYAFKNDVKSKDLLLVIDTQKFDYNEGGFLIPNERMFKNRKKIDIIYIKESMLKNEDFIFTNFTNVSTNTLILTNLSDFYYKDNIIFYNQNCKLNHFYIKSYNNPAESYSLLQCNHSNENEILYCDAVNYKFQFKVNDTFYLYIGKNQLITSYRINIYNSIKDAFFTLSYIKPTIYIESSNFDMEKISQFNIDNETITSNDNNYNISPSSNLITFKREVDNRTDHYVNTLRRKDHHLDRETTIKIKEVYLKIEKKKCPDFMVEVFAESGSWCITCAQKATSPGENGFNIWYQDGECVQSCSGNYSIYDQVKHYCMICPEKSFVNGQTICGCLEGTVKSPVDEVCYLPEDPEIKKALLVRPNVQCFRTDGMTYNYCLNDTTSGCEIISYSGYDFPICHCMDGYTGKYCEKKKNDINLNKNIEDIINLTNDDKINENDPVVISKIRGIVYFIEKDKSYVNSIDNNKINWLVEASINCVRTAINEKHKSYQIYDVIEIAVFFLYKKLNDTKKLRLLEEEEENRNKLNYLLENSHYANYLANKDYSGADYKIQTDGLNLISFISYRSNAIDSSFKTYIKNQESNSNIIGYTNLNGNNIGDDKENVMSILTIFNRKLFNLDTLDDGLIFNFSISNKDIELTNLKDFYAYIYSPNIKVNFELANYYQAKHINIYDKYDFCFTDACFTSENFEFDLTQKYRKKYVFQKWSLNSDICKYHSFENASNNIEILCQKFENFGKINDSIDYPEYATLDLYSKKVYADNQDKVYNLPMKCRKKMKSDNYAFWIFFIICILEIIYIIGITILTLGSLRRVSIRKGLYNDGFFYIIRQGNIKNSDDDSDSNDTTLKKKKDDYNNSTNEINEKPIEITYNKTLLEGILSNFKELHPLSVLCRVSIISPLIMNSWFLVFNILCLFGFNALIYCEGLIEKRIYDKKRNYFDYPMRKEFPKIILSILLQIALTVIIKLIILVSPKQYEDLESKFRKCKMNNGEINNDIILRYDNFQDEMFIRRLIGGFLMTIIIIFFFYYSVVFCEVYLNTQRNLVFSWVWSLFWEWVIFAPIYIVVISFLEHKKASSKDPLVYYLKRLFCF